MRERDRAEVAIFRFFRVGARDDEADRISVRIDHGAARRALLRDHGAADRHEVGSAFLEIERVHLLDRRNCRGAVQIFLDRDASQESGRVAGDEHIRAFGRLVDFWMDEGNGEGDDEVRIGASCDAEKRVIMLAGAGRILLDERLLVVRDPLRRDVQELERVHVARGAAGPRHALDVIRHAVILEEEILGDVRIREDHALRAYDESAPRNGIQ